MGRGLFVALTLFIISCSKNQKPVEPVSISLPIVSAESMDTVKPGENIFSKVHFELPSVGGTINLDSIEVKLVHDLKYRISATAIFTPWAQLVTLPVVWEGDTTIQIPTSSPGIYLLEFYTGTKLVKTDTVHVRE